MRASIFTVHYFQTTNNCLEDIGLGVTLWTGEFEGRNDTWLRWCDQDSNVLLTGDELAQQIEQRAHQAEQRVHLLAERLKALGVDPDTI